MVKRAYEQALFYAKPQGKTAPINNLDFSASRQYTVRMNSSPESLPQEEQSLHQREDQEYQFFDKVNEKINQENKRQEQEISNVLNIADGYYSLSRNNIKIWNSYFSSQPFRSLQKNPLFTASFLYFLENNQNMQSRVWNKSFLPILQEWALLWAGSELEVQFIRLAHPMKSKSKLRPELNAKEWLIAFIFIIIILTIIIYPLYFNRT